MGKKLKGGVGVVTIKQPKSMLSDCQNFIKNVILLDMFLWCHFNAMLIMECSAKWLIWTFNNSK